MTITVDYAGTYFEFPVLTKIHGEPTYENLHALKNQLKSNAQSLVSNLGGGAHGHLGLVLTSTEYALVSDVEYEPPVHPGSLHIPAFTAQHESIQLREDHREQIRIFRETIDVEKTLIKQIVQALDPEYLQELRDDATNSIALSLPAILKHLFDCFGEIDPDALSNEEEKVKILPAVFNIACAEKPSFTCQRKNEPRMPLPIEKISMFIVQQQ